MKIVQAYKLKDNNWNYYGEKQTLNNPLVLAFGNRYLLENKDVLADIRNEFPYEHIVFGSSAGEIINIDVVEESITVLAIEFEKSSFVIKRDNILDHNKDTLSLGTALSAKMPKENLKHLFIVSEGSFMSGTSLIKGFEHGFDKDIPMTGGLCGDDTRFERTLASYKEDPKEGEIILIGFYGDSLEISFASHGGWLGFGPERIITKSDGNVLYEIDDQPALELYKKYLGDKVEKLAESTLFYPLNVIAPGRKDAVVRTILSIDTEKQAMIFADNVPENSRVQLMMASADGISQGAYNAAKLAMQNREKKPQLAIPVSCIGRKLVLSQRMEEEAELIKQLVGENTAIAGFYSYGEIAPFYGNTSCEFHNQTMTLTLISE
ncbi:FIST signal transduction protein [Flavobacterium litorale]|uniref:FIST C-terminal domain-containing protein n=1 Tax=Flavobacterium litorale TaxID=2856519 RepID=A0ABX8V8L9_9FLAO|nr:FIST N-terminal domain-containing protein [Flavobacterium litorale]QYJ67558.1 FIST C-terminal domain-containing protein [Flavobacterium litorale]